jgi:hypothetical protein
MTIAGTVRPLVENGITPHSTRHADGECADYLAQSQPGGEAFVMLHPRDVDARALDPIVEQLTDRFHIYSPD